MKSIIVIFLFVNFLLFLEKSHVLSVGERNPSQFTHIVYKLRKDITAEEHEKMMKTINEHSQHIFGQPTILRYYPKEERINRAPPRLNVPSVKEEMALSAKNSRIHSAIDEKEMKKVAKKRLKIEEGSFKSRASRNSLPWIRVKSEGEVINKDVKNEAISPDSFQHSLSMPRIRVKQEKEEYARYSPPKTRDFLSMIDRRNSSLSRE